MRDRLVELLKKADKYASGVCTDYDEAQEVCADFLLAEGVIVPPCKVGDTVYQTDGIRIYESTIREITYTANNILIYDTEKVCFDKTAINESIFLTREEAEKALAERSGG